MKAGMKFAVTLFLAFSLLLGGCGPAGVPTETTVATIPSMPTETTVETQPPHHWETGYIAGMSLDTEYFDEAGSPLGTLIRGTQVEYELAEDGRTTILLDDAIVYLSEDAAIVADPAEVIPAHTLYVRTAVNLRDADGRLLTAFADKGVSAQVTGYDYLRQDGAVHMYRVTIGDEEGYVNPWYLADSEEAAAANYDHNGSYTIHAAREDQYGGGGAANLDYYPREKGVLEGNEMPSECRTLYLASWCLGQVDSYLEIANNSGINAFVVDIVDGGAVGYAADVMHAYCPTGAAAALNTVEEYHAAIQKLKDAGYYVIGRITTFNDSCFVQDHPEYAIADLNGQPLRLSGAYWPSPYSREAWQYKVDLAVEAVELMGFDEIQFDYVRFPDSAWRYERRTRLSVREGKYFQPRSAPSEAPSDA